MTITATSAPPLRPPSAAASARHSASDACGLPIATSSTASGPSFRLSHAAAMSARVSVAWSASAAAAPAASGVTPSTCSIGAAEVVPKAAQSAFRSSRVGRADASPRRSGMRSGAFCPAR